MTTHEPGRELDALVAERVMGWERAGTSGGCLMGWWVSTDKSIAPRRVREWRPSTDIAAAWEVVTHLWLTDKWATQIAHGEFSTVTMRSENHGHVPLNSRETPEHAICIATLEAVGVTL